VVKEIKSSKPPSRGVTKISEFMSRIGGKGGMSVTTGFDVQFDFNGNAFSQSRPYEAFYKEGSTDREVLHMLCDEAQLPNVQSATQNVNGRVLGEGSVAYPHTRIYTDISLGFLCDAQLTPLKFFTGWYDYIFGEFEDTNQSEGGKEIAYKADLEGARGVQPGSKYRVNRLQYHDEYVCDLRIFKTEPNGVAANGRAPITFILENAYPYSIDAVPLAYGTSQVTRVNVNFYYTRHSVRYGIDYRPKPEEFDDTTWMPKKGGLGLGANDLGSSIKAGFA
tara:strand:- start:63 stop:896 length:834 start_codon:yes stop_codon:yes gene_type:complete